MNDKLIISHLKGLLGNQLQQYATGLAVAKKLNARYKVDLSFFDNPQYRNWYKMDKINVNIEVATPEEIEMLKNKENSPLFYMILNKLGIFSEYRKKTDIAENFGFKADKRVLNLNHSAYIKGWCSSGDYVKEIRKDVLDQFKPKLPLSQCAQNYLHMIKSSNSVAVHIRRGDFLELQHFFRIVPVDYYKLAISQITELIENPKFFIFSNDIEWAKSNMGFIKDPIFVDVASCDNYEGFADIEEFELIKQCNHNINGNSSFSWWAAYLNSNPNKTVIVPKKWFNDKFYQSSIEKYPLCPPDWINI